MDVNGATFTRKNVLQLMPGDVIVESWHRRRPILRTVTEKRPEILSAFASLEYPGKTIRVTRQHSHLETCSDYGMVHLSTSKGVWCLSREESFYVAV